MESIGWGYNTPRKFQSDLEKIMAKPILINSDDPILKSLNFRAYRSKVERRVIPFMPSPDEPQTLEIDTPWGEQLLATHGDFLTSEVVSPNDFWPVDPSIFEETYVLIRPGYTVKMAKNLLVPLTDLTKGDLNQLVSIVTLEGTVTVRAGDFYLAKGGKGEIWPFPREKVDTLLVPWED